MSFLIVLLLILLSFSAIEPYWNYKTDKMTQFNPWYFINCEFESRCN